MTMTLSGDGTITGLVAGGLPNATVTADDLAAGAALNSVSDGVFFRNRIINGDMRIDQRNAGAAVTATASFPVDRFRVDEDTDGAFSAQQDSSAPAGFVNSIKLTTTTADASLGAAQYYRLLQRIEGTNVSDLGWGTANAKTVTLSFWVRSSLTGTFGGALSNSAADRSYPFTYSISAADTWEYKTITIPGDTSGTWLTTNGIGIRVNWGLGAGSTYSGTAGSWQGAFYMTATGATSVIGTLNATWYITGVQLEVGSVATPFERRPYGTELSLCQRYFQINKRISGYAGSTTLVNFNPIYYCPMRATPTLGQQGVIEINDNSINVTQSSVGISFVSGDSDGGFVQLLNLSGLTTNRPVVMRFNANKNGITLSAEL